MFDDFPPGGCRMRTGVFGIDADPLTPFTVPLPLATTAWPLVPLVTGTAPAAAAAAWAYTSPVMGLRLTTCSYFLTEGVRTMGAGSGSAKMFDFMRSTTRRRGDSVTSGWPNRRFLVSASEPRRLEAAELGVELVSDS